MTLAGFLGPDDYRTAVSEASMVLTLTTEPLSVMRAAYEAVYAGRPVIVSDWPIDRELFADAVHVGHQPEDLAAGVRRLASDFEDALARTGPARERQLARWEAQRTALLEAADSPCIGLCAAGLIRRCLFDHDQGNLERSGPASEM